jgi:hypothetical protein
MRLSLDPPRELFRAPRVRPPPVLPAPMPMEFHIRFPGRCAPAVGTENSGAAAGVMQGGDEVGAAATLDPFVLVEDAFWGVFRSTAIRLWCREPAR